MEAFKDPNEVFTPKSPARREMFEIRNEQDLDGNPGLQNSLMDALTETGGQVLIYGDSGVGKTSLFQYAATDCELPYVMVECLSSWTYDDLLDQATKRLLDYREISRTTRREVGGSAEGGGNVVAWSVKGVLRTSVASEKEYQAVQKAPIDVLIDVMVRSGKRLLALDNWLFAVEGVGG